MNYAKKKTPLALRKLSSSVSDKEASYSMRKPNRTRQGFSEGHRIQKAKTSSLCPANNTPRMIQNPHSINVSG